MMKEFSINRRIHHDRWNLDRRGALKERERDLETKVSGIYLITRDSITIGQWWFALYRRVVAIHIYWDVCRTANSVSYDVKVL